MTIMRWGRMWRSGIALLHDLLAIPVAWLLSYWLRFNLGPIPQPFLQQALHMMLPLLVLQGFAYFVFGLYRGIWRFASIPDLLRIIEAAFVGSAATAIVTAVFTHMQLVPRSVFPIYTLLLIAILGGSRFFYRWMKDNLAGFSLAKRVLIIGAGQGGEGLIRDLFRDVTKQYKPVAVLDDNRNKHGLEIHGIRVVAKIRDLVAVAKRFRVDLVFIAIPSANSVTMRRIVSLCEQAKLPFRTLPSLKDSAADHVSINALREVSLEDLLGREPVSLDWEQINNELSGKIVLVSGGGGSIGSEVCRQVAQLNPKKLIVLENSEFNLYQLDLELKEKFPQLNLIGLLVDVTDKIAVRKVLLDYEPEIIFHAAAYKHVPLLEYQLRIAVQNNILGTWILAEQAAFQGVKHFVLISTDKAVNPVNVLGASKRAAEVICQNLSQQYKTHFITVRFGNVLGSAGSVVPLFRQQIAAGGPVTVTHPEITRFFMTIPEATQLILQATVMGQGGEIFVLNMGEAVKISYLAEQMIQLAGLKVGTDIAIKYVGLRPGEKLREELFHEQETLMPTTHEKILRAQSRNIDQARLMQIIKEITAACEACDESKLLKLLLELVPEYQVEVQSKAKIENIVSFERQV